MKKTDWAHISREITVALSQWERKQVSEAAASGSKDKSIQLKGKT